MNDVFNYITDPDVALSPAMIVVSIVLGLIGLISHWIIFKKADEPGWASIVPLYNAFVMFRIAWGNGWKVLWLLVPLVNVVVAIILQTKLARSFSKSTGFALGLIFLPIIFYPILAFGEARYQGPDR